MVLTMARMASATRLQVRHVVEVVLFVMCAMGATESPKAVQILGTFVASHIIHFAYASSEARSACVKRATVDGTVQVVHNIV
jgi:hypothetical protein